MYVKGMVRVADTTYRIVRVEHARYNVVRILDDVAVGSFQSAPSLEVVTNGIEDKLLRDIARAAIQWGKTSWAGPIHLS
jgi:hypothetical protein